MTPLVLFARFCLMLVHSAVRWRMTRLDAHFAKLNEDCRAEAHTQMGEELATMEKLLQQKPPRPPSDEELTASRVVAARASVKLTQLADRASRVEARYDWWEPVDGKLAKLRANIVWLHQFTIYGIASWICGVGETWAFWTYSGDLLDCTTEAIRWASRWWTNA